MFQAVQRMWSVGMGWYLYSERHGKQITHSYQITEEATKWTLLATSIKYWNIFSSLCFLPAMSYWNEPHCETANDSRAALWNSQSEQSLILLLITLPNKPITDHFILGRMSMQIMTSSRQYKCGAHDNYPSLAEQPSIYPSKFSFTCWTT